MQVKLKKNKNYYQLIVDDVGINQKYDCTQAEPIVLAVLESWEGTKCWALRDLRLCEVVYPSPYLEGSNTEYYTPKNEEEEMWLTSTLKQYKKVENKYVWPTFNGIVAFGDKTSDPTNPEYVNRSMQGCWTYVEGMKKFNEIREFWEQFEGNDLESSKLTNPHRQPSAAYFSGLSSLLILGAVPKEEILKKWHTMNGYDEQFRIGPINGESSNKPKLK